jgi:hypothetical protein
MYDHIAAIHELLALFAAQKSPADYFERLVRLLRDWCRADAAGIRVRNDFDEVPYRASVGFPEGFCASENRLELGADSCLCTRAFAYPDSLVNAGRPPLPGELTEIYDDLALQHEKTRENLRGICPMFGFRSVAVIAIPFAGAIPAALHLASRSPGGLDAQGVRFVESLAPVLGEAINRLAIEKSLKHNSDIPSLLKDLLQYSFVIPGCANICSRRWSVFCR